MKSISATLVSLLLCALACSPAALAQNPNQFGYQSNTQVSTQFNGQNTPAGSVQSTTPADLKQWFARYDLVRRQAQMSPSEKDRADNILSQGLSIFIAGPNKVQAQKLLTGLVAKYQIAINQMKNLPLFPETSKLHRGYYQYFSDAKTLFSDYLMVQDNMMAQDQTGKRVMPQLISRKANLEALEHEIKELDGQLRSQYGIAPYRDR